jgi:2-hydroxychromene-2-carboxylate isomerase
MELKRLTFYLDFISPYAYLAFERLPQALHRGTAGPGEVHVLLRRPAGGRRERGTGARLRVAASSQH